jgi:hypothetical protein
MRKTIALIVLFAFAACSSALVVGDVSSLARARALAAEFNKPLLIEFYSET